ncbi:MAG: hypothetical protein OER80_01775 [Gammaproteobacteria bacterium]|nr:hypothetical protein [Gammaproteobacteria bacterium]
MEQEACQLANQAFFVVLGQAGRQKRQQRSGDNGNVGRAGRQMSRNLAVLALARVLHRRSATNVEELIEK